ncbi:MAG TPA: nucleotide exchange factor GrpE [Candidatus Marinimicrobia bacterium]|nr:nucleotide exchange factor GrpE [Candidatus Neomarinimicrobiota bacterium]
MSKKVKNGSNNSSGKVKPSPKKRVTKKDLENLIQSLEDKQLRLKAEFDNFRKRKESEISALLKYEGKHFILDFLSILDNINRGIDSYKDENIQKALLLIKEDFLKKMSSKEIKEFGEVGEIFNPELHEALTTANLKDKEEDEIVEVYEVGFKYKDLIIRHAKVVVNKK